MPAQSWTLIRAMCSCGWLRGRYTGSGTVEQALLRGLFDRHVARCSVAKAEGAAGRATGQLLYQGGPVTVQPRKGQTMAKATNGKVYRVTVQKDSGPAAGWGWFPTDAQGRVRISGGRAGYSRKSDAARGARRACGAKVRIVFA